MQFIFHYSINPCKPPFNFDLYAFFLPISLHLILTFFHYVSLSRPNFCILIYLTLFDSTIFYSISLLSSLFYSITFKPIDW